MDDIESLAAEIEQRKVARAREASIEEKLLDGPRLFRLSCKAMKTGMRLDQHDATEAEIHALLIDRVYGWK